MTRPRPYRDLVTIEHESSSYRIGVSDVGWIYLARKFPSGKHIRVAFDADTGVEIINAIADAIEEKNE